MTTALIVVLLAFVLLALGTPIFSVFLGVAAWGATVTFLAHHPGAHLPHLLGILHHLVHGSDPRTGVTGPWQDFGGQMQDIAKLGTGEPAQILSTIPLFIFAGFLMAESRTADRLVSVARAWLGWLPGGLAVVTIFACALFTTFTGASGVTIVALGGLLMPSLLKEKYPERFSLGLVAGTGSVGLLFPPALPLFVYGTVYGLVAQTMSDTGHGEMKLIEFSTDRFILAGIVPGLVLLVILIGYAIFTAHRNKVPRHRFEVDKLWRPLWVALPELFLPFGIIGLLIHGFLIPEVASIAVLWVLFWEVVVYRDLKLGALWRVVRESMALVGAIFIIIFAAQALTNFLVTAHVPDKLVAWILAHFTAQWSFLLGLNVLLLVVGMLMDIFSAIVIVVPLIAPAAHRMGIDPYHLGVIFLLNLEIGYLTPPVGLNLFITGFTFRKPIVEVVRASVPFLLCMMVALGLVTYVSALTIVPPKDRRGRVSELVREVHAAYQDVQAVQEITTPGGKLLKFADCAKLGTDLDRADCEGVFKAVTACRAKAGGKAGTDCEKKVVTTYLQNQKDDDSSDSDWGDDDTGDAGTGAGAGNSDAGTGSSGDDGQ